MTTALENTRTLSRLLASQINGRRWGMEQSARERWGSVHISHSGVRYVVSRCWLDHSRRTRAGRSRVRAGGRAGWAWTTLTSRVNEV